MSEKKSAPKENLTWKINYLAAQVGEKTHMKKAMLAASKTIQQLIQKGERAILSRDALKQELYNVRKLKLESKLHQARKDIKAGLKKGKQSETQKQLKKIKSCRKLLEDKKDTEQEEKPRKKTTAQDIEQYEKELDILKQIDLDHLVEKTLKSKLSKSTSIKNEPLIKDLVETLQVTPTEDQTTQNIESRLISTVASEVTTTLNGLEAIIHGHNDKIEKRKADEAKKKAAEEAKKRKAEEELKKPKQKQKKIKLGDSEFIETLGVSDDENEDENFKKIYEGEKKPNRVGQRQRRKQWEEMYGREANHVAEEYKKREEKRLANPDYRPKKVKPAPKPQPQAPSEPVHPSWEAKRIQEEIMSKALSGKGPSNNKIVFDDSD